MFTTIEFARWYAVGSVTTGALTTSGSRSPGGSLKWVLTDTRDGDPNGTTPAHGFVGYGYTGNTDTAQFTFQGYTENGDPVLFIGGGYGVFTNNIYVNQTLNWTQGGTLVFCFAQDTLISTPVGETRVDQLAIGDLVRTDDRAAVPVKWIGRQTVMPFFAGQAALPVIIQKGALDGGLPVADLTVTPDHGMVLDGYVINASALVNGGSIRFAEPQDLAARTTYYHVETDAHDVIFANGAAAETFVDTASRAKFDNFAEYVALYGTDELIAEMSVPRITASRVVPDHIRRKLAGARVA